MSDISKIHINPTGGDHDIKDATARACIESSKTLKSSVVTVNDAAPINAEDITVDITPVQDLHGYDRPWAGGGWKNKLPLTVAGIKAANTSGTWNGNAYTIENITFEILTDAADNITGFKVNGTASYDATLLLSHNIPGAQYNGMYLSGTPSGGSASSYLMLIQMISSPWVTYGSDYGNGGAIRTIPDDINVQIFIRVKRGTTITNKIFYPMISASGGDFAPYSNECPFEGWTGAELDRVGKNKLPMTSHTDIMTFIAENATGSVRMTGTGQNSGWANGIYISLSNLPAGNYIVSCEQNPNRMNVLVNWAFWEISPNGTPITVAQGDTVRFAWMVEAGQTYDCSISGLMLRLSTETDATYEPYQGQQYTADFGETVYGGKWHVTKGGTDKTHGNIANYNGETINEPWLSSLDEYVAGATPTTGAQVVYPLTTPTTISTPKQNVPMLQGINTVSADCGDVSLKYQPDNVIGELKGEIEDNIIYEDFKWTTESSRSYSAGTPGTYGCSSWRDVKKEGYDVIGVTFVENRRFGDCILTLYYIPSTDHVEVIIFRATSSAVTIADEDIEYRVAYKKRT